jgi:hypothetical protein
MQLDKLKQLVKEMELANAFDNIEAENCSMCCYDTNGGSSGC